MCLHMYNISILDIFVPISLIMCLMVITLITVCQQCIAFKDLNKFLMIIQGGGYNLNITFQIQSRIPMLGMP